MSSVESNADAYNFRMMAKELKATEMDQIKLFGVASTNTLRSQQIIHGRNQRETIYSLYEKRIEEPKKSFMEPNGSTTIIGASTPCYQDNPYDVANGFFAYSNQFYLHITPLAEIDLKYPLVPKYWMPFFPPSEDKVVYQLKLNPASPTKLAAGSLEEVYIFDLTKERYLYKVDLRKTLTTEDNLRSMTWNGEQTLMSSALKTIGLYDLRQQGSMEIPSPQNHLSVHLSTRGHYVLSGGKEDICLFDRRGSWQKPLQTYHGHTGEVRSFLWKSDHQFYSGGDLHDGQLKLWSDATSEALQTTCTRAAIVALKQFDEQVISIHGRPVTQDHQNTFNTTQVWNQTSEGLRRKEVIQLNSSQENMPLYNFKEGNQLFVVTPLVTNSATTLDVYEWKKPVKQLNSSGRLPLSKLR